MRELRVVLRTPFAVVFEGPVLGARFPSPSGQVGVRPGAEAWVTAMQPGLVLLELADERLYAATAGGLARHDGTTLTMFSPFGAVGTADEVIAALAEARADEEGELAALRTLSELEQLITSEVRTGRTAVSP